MSMPLDTRGVLLGRGPLDFTRHGGTRRQQRCLPRFVIDALVDFGDEHFLGLGSRSFSFSKQSWKQFSRYMGQAIRGYEKYRNVYVVVAEDGVVITVAWRH